MSEPIIETVPDRLKIIVSREDGSPLFSRDKHPDRFILENEQYFLASWKDGMLRTWNAEIDANALADTVSMLLDDRRFGIAIMKIADPKNWGDYEIPTQRVPYDE